MKIGIIDADLLDKGTRHPNLALMKISGYHKEQGDDVELLNSYDQINQYDHVYISKVFNFTIIPNEEEVIHATNITYGGTGFYPDGGPDLPTYIEHHKPDYSLYYKYIDTQLSLGKKRSEFTDYLDYSIGFTTRGCFRKCEFCVNKKYDHAFRHSAVEEFLDETRPFIYLWDDNVLSFKGWKEVFDELNATGKPFQFRQGLDLRILDEKRARVLAESHIKGDVIFAFDHIEDRDRIERKLKLWRRYTKRTTKLYVLCAYDSIDITDIVNTLERIKILMHYGCLPYIMRYETYKESKFRQIYTELARWCNQPEFFKKKSFRQFLEANQDYHENKSTNCAAYQALLDFNRDYPEIVSKYFDLRYDQENIYMNPYGYGHKFANKPACSTCKKDNKTWCNAINNDCDASTILNAYFSQDIDLECLRYDDSECSNIEKCSFFAKWFTDTLISTSWEELLSIITDLPVSSRFEKIPTFSNLNLVIHDIPRIISKRKIPMNFKEVESEIFDNTDSSVVTHVKDHAKLAALLDLVVINNSGKRTVVSSSILGKKYNSFGERRKEKLAAKLLLRIPQIQVIIRDGLKNQLKSLDDYLEDFSNVAKSTRKRELMELLSFMETQANNEKITEIYTKLLAS